MGIFVVAEAPGEVEDKQNTQLVGPAGQFLREQMEAVGLDLDRDCWRQNVVRCRPPGNREPAKEEIEACRRLLEEDIRQRKPDLIIAFGTVAMAGVLYDAPFVPTAVKMHERILPSPLWGCWVACGYHPSWYLHEEGRHDHLMRRFLEKVLKWLEDHEYQDPRLDEDDFQLVEDLEQVREVLRRASESKTPVAVDFETNCLSPWQQGAKLLTVGLTDSEDTGWCVPVEHIGARWSPKELEEVKRLLAEFLASPAPKVIQNWASMEEPWSVVHLGTSINNVIGDTMVREHVLDNRRGVCGQEFQTYVRYGTTYKSEVNRVDLARTPLDLVARYNVLDCRYMLRWYKDQEREFDADETGDLRRACSLFHESLPVMARCKVRGIKLDLSVLDRLERKVKAEQQREQKAMNAACLKRFRQRYGRRWKPGSNRDKQLLFYGLLGLKPTRLTNKGIDWTNPLHCSTDEESLLNLLEQVEPDGPEAALIRLCLRGSELTKLGGEIANLRRMADDNGYVHPSFHLHVAESYRSSSSDPNFQNIPVRDPEMAEVRKAFVPRLDWLMELDFSGNEVRAIACASRDERLIYNIAHDVDYHRHYAALLFAKPEEEITKQERYLGKNQFVFPQFYGSYWKSIANKNPQWPIERVRKVEEKFWRDLPGVREWQERKQEEYRRLGYVRLMTGFRVHWGKHGPLTRNQICNIPIQGPAFHRLLAVMIKVEAEMNRRGLRSMVIGQIHDSIVSDIADDELEEVIELQRTIATQPIWDWDKAVPWEVEVKVGPNLLEMEVI